MTARPMTHAERMASLPPGVAATIRRSAAEVAAAAPPMSVTTRAALARLFAGAPERIRSDRERRAREAA